MEEDGLFYTMNLMANWTLWFRQMPDQSSMLSKSSAVLQTAMKRLPKAKLNVVDCTNCNMRLVRIPCPHDMQNLCNLIHCNSGIRYGLLSFTEPYAVPVFWKTASSLWVI